MKTSIKLCLLYLPLMMATQITYANDTSPKTLTVNTEQVDNLKVNSDTSNSSVKERFIPVELFTGAKWNGKHELTLKEVSTTACASLSGKRCDNYYLEGPFKTETNNTKIEWVGNEIPYYKRTFSTRRMGKVESHFTINNSKDGLVRIYDKRKQWGARTYSGIGSKFPLGYWKQGEIRTYPSRMPIRIEIIELDGPDHCLTFRWVIGDGKKKNMDNNYTYCPGRGFTKISHNS